MINLKFKTTENENFFFIGQDSKTIPNLFVLILFNQFQCICVQRFKQSCDLLVFKMGMTPSYFHTSLPSICKMDFVFDQLRWPF